MRWPTSISNGAILWAGIAWCFANYPASSAEFATPLENVEREVCAVYDAAKDAIVKVHAEHQAADSDLAGAPAHRIGTGFFVTRDGVVLTSAAVVRDGDTCWVDWHDKAIPARVRGRCERTHLAVLQIDGPTPFLAAGDSDGIRVGSVVVTIGYPFDLPCAPVMGFIAGLDIRRGTNVFPTTCFRASSRISPGQAGSPVLNAKAQVIGIAWAAHLEDQAYVLPIKAAKRVYEDILQFGQVQFGWVGLEVGEHSRVWPEAGLTQTDLVVKQVFPGTPAAAAGFLPGDTLVQVATNDVRSLADVLDPVFYRRSGETVGFTVLRSNQQVLVSLTIGTRPDAERLAASPPTIVPPRPLRLVPVAGEQ